MICVLLGHKEMSRPKPLTGVKSISLKINPHPRSPHNYSHNYSHYYFHNYSHYYTRHHRRNRRRHHHGHGQ